MFANHAFSYDLFINKTLSYVFHNDASNNDASISDPSISDASISDVSIVDSISVTFSIATFSITTLFKQRPVNVETGNQNGFYSTGNHSKMIDFK